MSKSSCSWDSHQVRNATRDSLPSSAVIFPAGYMWCRVVLVIVMSPACPKKPREHSTVQYCTKICTTVLCHSVVHGGNAVLMNLLQYCTSHNREAPGDCPALPTLSHAPIDARSFLEAVTFTSASNGTSGSTYRLSPEGRKFLHNEKVRGEVAGVVWEPSVCHWLMLQMRYSARPLHPPPTAVSQAGSDQRPVPSLRGLAKYVFEFPRVYSCPPLPRPPGEASVVVHSFGCASGGGATSPGVLLQPSR